MTESLSDAQREEYARFFKDADVNNDGILTIHELSDMLKKLGFKRTNDEIVVSINNHMLNKTNNDVFFKRNFGREK